MRKIIKNSIKCNLCGDIIESKFRHHYVECSCGACFVDGGQAYQRIGYKEVDSYTDLSLYEEAEPNCKEKVLDSLLVKES